MHIALTDVIGFATVNEYRLKVYPRVAHSMATLLAICFILVGLMLFIVPTKSLLPQNPSTVLGLALLFSCSPRLLAQLRNAGACDSEYLAHYLGASEFQSECTLELTSSQIQYTIVDTEVSKGESNYLPISAS